MDNMATIVKKQQYTKTLFTSWTNGPKWVIDTMCNSNLLNINRVAGTNVIVVDKVSTLDCLLDKFPQHSVATLYFIEDEMLAKRAMIRRPDLNIILVQVDWDSVNSDI